MALKGGTKDETVKVQFNTREGTYKQLPISNYFYPKRMPYVPQVPASSSTLVKTTFVTVGDGDNKEDCICFTIGKELFYFTYQSFKLSKPYDYLDKRTYKGVAPTCHDVNSHTASSESVRVAVGFIAGQVQIIDVQTKESLLILNDERLVEKSKVTCVKWYPNSENLLLASHISGFMYTYDITQTCSTYIPQYHNQPYKCGDGYTILTLKPKTASTSSSSSSSNGAPVTPRNPVYKWIMSTDGSGVHEFAFSPCSRFVAIVTQNGFLRIIDHTTFEMYGCMKSYFGGLLTCCWSPDGRFLVTGGEDDLITVWSLSQQCVIARGSGHRSWISEVAFDPFCCTIPSDADMKTFYGIPSVNDIIAARKSVKIDHQMTSNKTTSFNDCQDNKQNLPADEPNSDNIADSGIQMQCNGDIQLPVSVNAIRRLRTYSNVSKLSRLSLGLDSGTPPLCYRFGSVGQDAQLCLWEIDETILYASQKKTKRLERPPSQVSADLIENSPVHVNGINCHNDLPFTSSSGSDYSSSGSAPCYKYTQPSANTNDVLSPLASDSRSSSVPHSINSSLLTTKNRKHSSKTETNSNGLSAIRKFATIGSHDHARRETKDHKRNLSLPHFGFKSSHNSLNSSSSKGGISKKQQVQAQTQTFGTYLCPHLEDTTMLEPLVCKKISKSRITCLDFKEDAVITTCQDGYLQLWQRPGQPELMNSHPSSPMTEQLTPNGTVV